MNVLKIRNDANSPWVNIDSIIGKDGFAPTIEVKEETENTYILTVTNQDGSYDTPNLKGAGGGTSVDLTNYYTKSEVDTKVEELDAKIEAIDIPDVSAYQTEEQVLALINAQLGVIENGSY